MSSIRLSRKEKMKVLRHATRVELRGNTQLAEQMRGRVSYRPFFSTPPAPPAAAPMKSENETTIKALGYFVLGQFLGVDRRSIERKPEIDTLFFMLGNLLQDLYPIEMKPGPQTTEMLCPTGTKGFEIVQQTLGQIIVSQKNFLRQYKNIYEALDFDNPVEDTKENHSRLADNFFKYVVAIFKTNPTKSPCAAVMGQYLKDISSYVKTAKPEEPTYLYFSKLPKSTTYPVTMMPPIRFQTISLPPTRNYTAEQIEELRNFSQGIPLPALSAAIQDLLKKKDFMQAVITLDEERTPQPIRMLCDYYMQLICHYDQLDAKIMNGAEQKIQRKLK